MKKIMIYAKHGRSFGELRSNVKINADTVLFFIVFICGLMIGCSLYFSVNGNNIFAKATAQAVEYGVINNLLLRSVLCFMFALTGIFGGVSGLGMLPLLLLPGINGVAYGLLASHLIFASAANGLGLFALTVLPGGIMLSTALIFFCAHSANASKQTAAILFFGRNEALDVKEYFIKNALYFGLMMAGVLFDYVSNLLFAGLF